MAFLNPDDCIPQGVHEGYRKKLTELFCGGLGVEKIDREAMARFKTLEVLWLNDNKLNKLKGLEDNFRLKHLYLHNNRIASITTDSCCIGQLAHLETLQLENNLLQNLQATLGVLRHLTSLKQLNMLGNPLNNEQDYRQHVVFQLPSLELLDNFKVTAAEKAAAINFFGKKKIEKKMAFGSVLEPWDKVVPNVKYAPSECEAVLAKDVRATHRRRGAAQKERDDAAMRAAARPRFEVTSLGGNREYEFIARGRMPTLLVRLGALQLAPQLAAAAASAKAGASSGAAPAKVYVKVNAMGILPTPRRTRSVDVTTAVGPRAPPDFRFEEEILASHAAVAYERGLQLLQTGPEEAMSLSLQLCEEASGRVLASGRVPIGDLLRDQPNERTEQVEAVLREAGGSKVHFEEAGRLSVSVATDWNLACTSSDYLQHHRQRSRVHGAQGAAMASAIQQEAEDEALGKRTAPPRARLEVAWQSVVSDAGVDASGRGGARLNAAQLLDVMRLMGAAATREDLDELLGTVAQPKPPPREVDPLAAALGTAEAAAPEEAPAPPAPTATLAQFRRAIAGFETRHATLARESMDAGELAEAHRHSQAALRVSATLLAASEPPVEVTASRQATVTESGRFVKDSFTMFRYERPAPGTAPDIPASTAVLRDGSASNIKLDKPRYDEFLRKKALLAPARGKQLLMTI